MKRIKFLEYWFLLAIVTILLSGLVYVASQQVLRQGANDPQIAMTEDISRALASGGNPEEIYWEGKGVEIDAEKSLAPFVSIFDEIGTSTYSWALINGKLPVLPGGVFEYTRTHGEDRITWEPVSGVRLASVIVHYKGVREGFVLVARNMREVEERERNILKIAAIGCIFTLIITFVIGLSLDIFLEKKR